MSELLPCPFCGGNARATTWTPTAASVSCTMCGAHFNTYTEAEAIAAWNTRAERTCKAELNESRNAVTCSECGSPVLLKGWEEYRDWEGSTRIASFTTYRYCLECGAKVVGS